MSKNVKSSSQRKIDLVDSSFLTHLNYLLSKSLLQPSEICSKNKSSRILLSHEF